MESGKNIYFISDVHLGFPNHKESLVREKILVNWLDSIKDQTEELFLMGDIFDFWFEYKRVVPRGFSRFLGKISEFTDSGIPVHFFTGNHDIWVFDYLPAETGIKLHRKPIIREFNSKVFYLAHGDGLGPFDKNFKRMKKVFTSPFFQWCFHRVHPNFGVKVAHSWSRSSRYKKPDPYKPQPRIEDEWLYQYADSVIKIQHVDYFIFGHRHIPMTHPIGNKSTFVNLGDWINNFTFGVYDGEKFELKKAHDKKKEDV